MRQNTTDENETPEGISVQKHDVIRLLIEGETVSAAASAVGVHRSTVHRWLSTDAAFCAELNRLKDDLVHANHQRLLLLVERTIGVFETGLSESDGKLALSFLRSMGFVLPHRSSLSD